MSHFMRELGCPLDGGKKNLRRWCNIFSHLRLGQKRSKWHLYAWNILHPFVTWLAHFLVLSNTHKTKLGFASHKASRWIKFPCCAVVLMVSIVFVQILFSVWMRTSEIFVATKLRSHMPSGMLALFLEEFAQTKKLQSWNLLFHAHLKWALLISTRPNQYQ